MSCPSCAAKGDPDEATEVRAVQHQGKQLEMTRLESVEQTCRELKSEVKQLNESLAAVPILQHDVQTLQHTVQQLSRRHTPQGRRPVQQPWWRLWSTDEQEDMASRLEAIQTTVKWQETQIQKLQSQVYDKEREVQRLKAELYSYKQRGEGHSTIAEGNKHSKVQNEYERLFANTASKLVTGRLGTKKPRETRRLLSYIFEVAYDECKTAVLLLICDDIYQKHTNLSDPEREALERKLQAFGDILLSNPLPDKAVYMDTIIDQLLQKVTGLPETLQEVKDEDASGRLREFMHKAVEVAWNMVTVQPPMVIDVQPNYNEEFHDPQHSHWDDDLLEGNYEMEYHRPTLFRSCMGELGGKGLVAMKDK